MTVNVLGESYVLKFIPEEEDEGLKDCDGYCDETVKNWLLSGIGAVSREVRKPSSYKRKRTSGMRLFTHFSTKAALRKTPHGHRKKKWWTGLPSSSRSCWPPFGRWMPCEESPQQPAARILQAL